MAGFAEPGGTAPKTKEWKSLKHKWLHKQQKTKLLIFCNGWGMDGEPVKHLKSDSSNVLMLYDYTSLESEINIAELVNTYKTISLISWSMGVWAGQQIFNKMQMSFTSSIAINGTLCPISDSYGIPEKIVHATHDTLNEKQRLKFYYRMCRDRDLYKRFITNQPKRTVADQKQELNSLLENAICKAQEKPVYSRAIVASHDLIIPTQNQLEFWPEKIVKQVDGSHFLFYAYASWDELLKMAEV
jgi:biotin synthesis protein BioG